jgi:murein L,D-transpeptidase YafK
LQYFNSGIFRYKTLANTMVKNLLIILLASMGFAIPTTGQTFLQQQMQYPVFRTAFEQKDSVLKRQFEEKGLSYPAHYLYLRSFKYDSRLEVWVKNNPTDTFTLFKSYRICALSGTMGPKRQEGDRQVPEGFYYINEFNPRSTYHMALGLNYPNFSDRAHGGKNPGGGIYIHGSCVTVGCIPLTNPQIEEVYLLAAHARDLGQNYIPVHIFPVQFNNKRSVDFLNKGSYSGDISQQFWVNLKTAYDDFNRTHRLPLILFDGKGNYIVESNSEAPGAEAPATAENMPAVPARGTAGNF